VHVRATSLDVGVGASGSSGTTFDWASFAQLAEADERLKVATAQQRPDPERAGGDGEEPLHQADATLARLLATPVAPSTRSGVHGAGPIQSMGR
jgi:hypothetical protein